MDMIKSTIFILIKESIVPSILSTRTYSLQSPLIGFSWGGVLQKAATDNSRTAWNISCSAPETGTINVRGVTCVATRFSFVFAFDLFGSVRIFCFPIHLLNSRVTGGLYYRQGVRPFYQVHSLATLSRPGAGRVMRSLLQLPDYHMFYSLGRHFSIRRNSGLASISPITSDGLILSMISW